MKTLVVDIDDTLTTSNSWERLNAAAGLTPEEDYGLYMAFVSGEIDYASWTDTLASLYKERGLLTEAVATKALNDFTLRDGVVETFELLRQRGYTIVLISGGFRVMVEAVQSILKADTSIALSDLAFDSEGTFDHFISNGEEGAAKLRTIEGYCQIHHISPHDCVAVGDSINDTLLFDLTGNGVTFSWCKPNIQARAKYVIDDIRDFPPLLDIL